MENIRVNSHSRVLQTRKPNRTRVESLSNSSDIYCYFREGKYLHEEIFAISPRLVIAKFQAIFLCLQSSSHSKLPKPNSSQKFAHLIQGQLIKLTLQAVEFLRRLWGLYIQCQVVTACIWCLWCQIRKGETTLQHDSHTPSLCHYLHRL